MRRKITYIMGVIILMGAVIGCGKKESVSTETKSDVVSEETSDMLETEENDQEEEVTESSPEVQVYEFGYEE